MANLALTRANIMGGSVTGWNFQTAASTDWVELEYIRGGKVNFETLSTKDSVGRNRPFAVKMVATVQSIATATEVAILHELTNLTDAEIDHQIRLDTGETIDTSLVADGSGNPAATEGGVGLSWKFVSDADRDDTQYIEFTVERIMTIGQADTILGGTFDTTQVASDSGFTAWAQTITDIVPAGFNTVKADTDASGWEDNFGIIRNGKFTAESLTQTDAWGRNLSDGRIKISLEFEMMQASATETSLLDQIAGYDGIDYQIVFQSGRTAEIANALGFDYNFEVASDREGIAFIKVMAEGIIPASDWNAIWTA